MSECNCTNMCRNPSTELAGKPKMLKMSNHHPDCPEYKLVKFTNVAHDGTTCIMSREEAKQMIEESNEVYITQDVYMTQDQFDNLPEFAGW